jgi:hypothetical protein
MSADISSSARPVLRDQIKLGTRSALVMSMKQRRTGRDGAEARDGGGDGRSAMWPVPSGRWV